MSRSYELALTLVGSTFKYTATVIRRLHAIINQQLPAVVESQGQGIRAARYGDTSFQVTAGTGLQVLIAPGAGTILGSTLPSAYIERSTQLALTVPASSVSYVWQGLENNPPSNRTEETGLPLSFVSSNAVEPNAIPLATVTTSGSAVTGIVDTRGLPIDQVDPEQIRDAIGTALTNSTTIAKTVDDPGDTISLSVIDNSLLPAKHAFPALGDLLYGGSAGAGTRLAGSTLAAKRFLVQTGTGTVSAAPIWGALSASDLPAGAPIIANTVSTATIATTTDVQRVDTANANTQTLPATMGNRWGFIVIKNIQTSSGITVAAATGTTVESGVPTLTAAGSALSFFLDGTVWRVM